MSAETPSYQLVDLLYEQQSIEISRGEYDEIVTAQTRLVAMLAVEEKLEYVLANFEDYEGDLLRLALKQSVWPERNYSAFRFAQHLVNRRVVNLLSTTRLYLDQVKHELSAMYGKKSEQLVHFVNTCRPSTTHRLRIDLLTHCVITCSTVRCLFMS